MEVKKFLTCIFTYLEEKKWVRWLIKMIEIYRQYLEIKNLKELNEVKKPDEKCSVKILNNPDFQLNKFFYKKIGKNHRWTDRLSWTDRNWNSYLKDINVKTFILNYNNELAGYFEQIFNPEKNEYEIAYFGILREFRNKRYGAYLLSYAIKSCFKKDIKRVWVHTCSLDHKNAIYNYLARGMKIFKKDIVKISA